MKYSNNYSSLLTSLEKVETEKPKLEKSVKKQTPLERFVEARKMKDNNPYEKVYANDGEFLGDEYVDLSGLQLDTRRSICHMIYLDNLIQEAEIALINASAKEEVSECNKT